MTVTEEKEVPLRHSMHSHGVKDEGDNDHLRQPDDKQRKTKQRGEEKEKESCSPRIDIR